MEHIDVSVCIATFRRPRALARLLESLGRVKLPAGLRAELIVVDNDPDAMGAPALPALGFAMRGLLETRRNLAHARNTAVEAARGEWLAFVDDDETVDERWLEAYWEWAQQRECDAFFGPVLPRLEAVVTPWLTTERFYARPRFATGTCIDHRDARTGNAFVRRALLREARFDPAFGRSGGEDTDLFRRLVARGARFEWCDEALVSEWLPAERHRFGWLVRRAFRGGCVHVEIERKLGRERAPALGAARAILAGLWHLADAAFRWPAGRAESAPRFLRAAVQAGQLWAHLGQRYEEYAG